jgi:orotate phosphoribosyltransferase
MKKLIFIISLIAIMVLMCTVISAEETPQVTSTYYLVQSYNSEAAISSQAEGKSIVVVDDLMTTDGSNMSTFFASVNSGDHIEIILAENIYTNSAANRGILINKAITLTIRYN